MNILSGINEIRGFLKAFEVDKGEWKVPARWMATLDACQDIVEKADSLRVAVELGMKDCDMCTEDAR